MCLFIGYSLSNTLEKSFVISAIKKAIKEHGTPEIMNSDQGAQFTSEEYVNLLKGNSIKISMDGKGRALDNQRIERFLEVIQVGKAVSRGMRNRAPVEANNEGVRDYYNHVRPHESLSYETPAASYYGSSLDTEKAV